MVICVKEKMSRLIRVSPRSDYQVGEVALGRAFADAGEERSGKAEVDAEPRAKDGSGLHPFTDGIGVRPDEHCPSRQHAAAVSGEGALAAGGEPGAVRLPQLRNESRLLALHEADGCEG